MTHLLLASLFPLFALDAVGTAIEQAQSLALKKNRGEACAILQRAFEATPPTVRSRGKLVESMHQISTVFFTDKGQKEFEAGQAAMWETPELAMTHFRASLELENGNLQVLANIARLQLAKQECDGALATLAPARVLNPHDADSFLLEMRAHACQNNFDLVREKIKDPPTLSKWQQAYMDYLSAQDALQRKEWKRAMETTAKLSEVEPAFPETYFLLARAGEKLERDSEPYLQKYVSLCKGITAREKKRFALEPRLCANLKEAEDELARKSTEL